MKFSNSLTWDKYTDNSKIKSSSVEAYSYFHFSCGFTIISSTTTPIANTNISTIIILFSNLILYQGNSRENLFLQPLFFYTKPPQSEHKWERLHLRQGLWVISRKIV